MKIHACKVCNTIWLVGCFGFSGPLRQYYSLYRAVFQREGERGEKGKRREKMPNQPQSAPTASAIGPCPTLIQISRTPRHWKTTQHHRTTRPPHMQHETDMPVFANVSMVSNHFCKQGLQKQMKAGKLVCYDVIKDVCNISKEVT